MKERKPNLGLSKICRLFGVTRQAYYQYFERNIDTELEHELIITEVLKIRRQNPRIGTRKLYVMLECFMHEHQIKMGRDALFNLLSVNNLLIRRRKRLIKTTQSHHWLKKYPNRFKLCHVKDLTKTVNNGHDSCVLGTGTIDFKKVLKAGAKYGLETFIVEQEAFTGTNPIDAAGLDAKYMQKNF